MTCQREQLLSLAEGYDALVVRSQTRIDDELLAAAPVTAERLWSVQRGVLVLDADRAAEPGLVDGG